MTPGFAGNRALRGNKLPRGYQNVAALEVQAKGGAAAEIPGPM